MYRDVSRKRSTQFSRHDASVLGISGSSATRTAVETHLVNLELMDPVTQLDVSITLSHLPYRRVCERTCSNLLSVLLSRLGDNLHRSVSSWIDACILALARLVLAPLLSISSLSRCAS